MRSITKEALVASGYKEKDFSRYLKAKRSRTIRRDFPNFKPATTEDLNRNVIEYLEAEREGQLGIVKFRNIKRKDLDEILAKKRIKDKAYSEVFSTDPTTGLINLKARGEPSGSLRGAAEEEAVFERWIRQNIDIPGFTSDDVEALEDVLRTKPRAGGRATAAGKYFKMPYVEDKI